MQHQNLWSKIIFSGLIGGLLMSTSLAHAEEQVLCIPTKNVLVFQSNLKSVVFSGDQFEVVRAFQGWGEVKKTITVKGQRVTYVKTQFVDRQEEDAENDIGWVRESHIKLKSKCAGYTRADNTNDDSVKLSFQSDAGDGITGLNDVDCCRFPLNSSAHANYTTGMRQFGWGRGAGRKHAAADLYHRSYEPVYAVADGVILRDRQTFYGGTSATEVRHTGGFIGRYGEIASAAQKPGLKFSPDGRVRAGQLLGYIKATTKRSGALNPPMLHFELYTGKLSGPLSIKGAGAYSRRADLINPTKHLLKWEAKR